jgi:hypothetical protein
MAFRRKMTPDGLSPNRFDRWRTEDLINLIEAEMTRSGELFRGLSHSEIDQEWLLHEMRTHVQGALEAIQALERKVATVQSI